MSTPPWVSEPMAAPPGPERGAPPNRRGPSPVVAAAVLGGAVVLVAAGVLLVLLLRGDGSPPAEPALEILPEAVPPAPDPEPDPEPEPEPVTDADLEITLNWSSHADLDLVVVDPQGNEIGPGTLPPPGGGTRDTAANDGCAQTRAPARERVRFEQGEARSGSYEVQVHYAAECDQGTGPQDVEVRVVLPAVGVATFTDTLEPGERLALLDVRFPTGEVFDLRSAAAAGPPDAPEPAPAPAPAPPPEPEPEPEPIPRGNVAALPSGLFCRDLLSAGYPYWDAVTYWEREGRPARMDATGDGIPCTTTYPWNDVRDYWGQLVDPDFQEGGDVS